jgi:voltage-gated potassium channel
MHKRFLLALGHNLRIVWGVLSGILVWQLVLGLLITWLERWPVGDGLYFTFVTGLTIGYGDLVPRQPLSRFLAILIGLFGVVLTGLVAAIAVRALQTTVQDIRPADGRTRPPDP